MGELRAARAESSDPLKWQWITKLWNSIYLHKMIAARWICLYVSPIVLWFFEEKNSETLHLFKNGGKFKNLFDPNKKSPNFFLNKTVSVKFNFGSNDPIGQKRSLDFLKIYLLSFFDQKNSLCEEDKYIFLNSLKAHVQHKIFHINLIKWGQDECYTSNF